MPSPKRPSQNDRCRTTARVRSEYANTRKFLALVPDDKLTWKPHEKSMELGRLAWHVSDFPSWCTDALKKMCWPLRMKKARR